MGKRKEKEVKEVKADPLEVSQDFIGMFNGKNFNLKKGDFIEAPESEIEWLKSKGVLK